VATVAFVKCYLIFVCMSCEETHPLESVVHYSEILYVHLALKLISIYFNN